MVIFTVGVFFSSVSEQVFEIFKDYVNTFFHISADEKEIFIITYYRELI